MLVNLCAEMARFGVTVSAVAKTINREERAVKNRLSGKIPISAEDIKLIRDTHFPSYTLDYLLSEVPLIVEPRQSA